jgi:magnesium chelatase ATPase subunit I
MSRRTAGAQPNAPLMPPQPHASSSPPTVYPFTAIVGQEEMKLALLLNVIEPSIGGVLIMGHRGTGKSTAVRALADLLPTIWKVRDCAYGCDPLDHANLCADCLARLTTAGRLARVRARVPVVDLPLGATEDRVCGTINIERALTEGVRSFDPGLLARANRGFLYIDEVNLLEDHLVDLLLDVSVTGRNSVEREGISVEHPARFVLVGSGNPEEGELRPQLQDRFGLHVEVLTANSAEERVEIILACEAFERDAAKFSARFEAAEENLRRRLTRARKRVHQVQTPRQLLRHIAELCVRLRVDGHRGELTITRAARALAAFEGRVEATAQDVRRVAMMSLRHRLRRDPLEQTDGGAQIEQALENLFPQNEASGNHGGSKRESAREDFPPTDFAGDSGGAHAGNAGADNGSDMTGEERRRSGSRREQSAAPALDARLPENALDAITPETHGRTQAQPGPARHERDASRRRSTYNIQRGRYARAVIAPSERGRIALDATLRAAAGKTGGRGRVLALGKETPTRQAQPSPPIVADDLRFKRYRRKQGTLFIFTVDASGSMALNRINQAKGALVNLLQRSYVRRDQVAVVSFRAEAASVLLPPSRSVARARRVLDALSVGGSTPLAAGLLSSLEIARRAARQGAHEIVLLLFTDGRANVSLLRAAETRDKAARAQSIKEEIEGVGAELRRAGVASVVIEGQRLADALGGRYVYFGPGLGVAREQFSALSQEAQGKR